MKEMKSTKIVNTTPQHITYTAKDLFDQAEILVGQKKYREAIQFYDQALKITPSSHVGIIWNQKGMAYHKSDNLIQAKESFEKAIEFTGRVHPLPYNNLAGVLFDLKAYPEALNAANMAISLKGDYHDAYNIRGSIYKSTGSLQDALSDFQRAIDISRPSGKINPKYFENMGLVLLNMKRYKESSDSYNEAIKLGSQNPEVFYNRGIALKELNSKFDITALDMFEKAIKLKPDHVQAHNAMGNLFAELGDHDKAIKCYELAIKLNPDYAQSYNGLAASYGAMGHLEEAITFFDKAIEKDPTLLMAYHNKEDLFRGMGILEEADKIQDIIKALESSQKETDDSIFSVSISNVIYTKPLPDSLKNIVPKEDAIIKQDIAAEELIEPEPYALRLSGFSPDEAST